jgi:hypothetical protein
MRGSEPYTTLDVHIECLPSHANACGVTYVINHATASSVTKMASSWKIS